MQEIPRAIVIDGRDGIEIRFLGDSHKQALRNARIILQCLLRMSCAKPRRIRRRICGVGGTTGGIGGFAPDFADFRQEWTPYQPTAGLASLWWECGGL